MFPYLLSPELVEKIRTWPSLKRWERREIGQQLRCLGLTYREIGALIPVKKGTLSGWCRDIALTERQTFRIAEAARRGSSRVRNGELLRARNLERVAALRQKGRAEAVDLLADPFWVAGVSLYWAEGSKRVNQVTFSNSDPAMVRLFINWASRYFKLDPARFTAALHLHTGQDDSERKEFWSRTTGIPVDAFRKTFIKAEGTGHRKNILYHGTIKVRITCSTDLLHRLLGWIDVVAEQLASFATMAPLGR
jgi:hypothetical protein